MEKYKFDFLVIGGGLAGLYAAYRAAKYGKVALLTKSLIRESNSYHAQGGIAAVISDNDKPEFHISDTLEAGRGLCRHKAVEILVNEGRDRIREIIELGMQFDKSGDKYSLGLEGGHSQNRILHAGGNSTGQKVIEFFLPLVQHNENITIFENSLVYKLEVNNGVCSGGYALNIESQKCFEISAGKTIIAAGGACGIYMRTTNPEVTTGDGIAAAFNAGAELEGMEFIQFHPTSFYTSKGATFLISEALRGEGAHLVNNSGERFMKKVHDAGELAPRDIVAKEIFLQMKKNKTSCVYLKADHLDSENLKKRFRNVYTEAEKYNIDITKDLIPVAPAAHYLMGGIKTDENGRTCIEGLYACGESASSGVHGANRLASNSLLECLVFARRAVDDNYTPPATKEMEKGSDELSLEIDERNRALYLNIKNVIAELMTQNAGIVRNSSELNTALKSIEKIELKNDLSKREYYSILSKNLLTLAKVIILSAIERKESRGGHLREDYAGESSEECTGIVIKNDFVITRSKIN